METLGEALPKEQERVREVLGHYKEIGPAGVFGFGATVGNESALKYQNELLDKCQQSLPRDQECVLIAIPMGINANKVINELP